jgi:hypothetical protein
MAYTDDFGGMGTFSSKPTRPAARLKGNTAGGIARDGVASECESGAIDRSL